MRISPERFKLGPEPGPLKESCSTVANTPFVGPCSFLSTATCQVASNCNGRSTGCHDQLAFPLEERFHLHISITLLLKSCVHVIDDTDFFIIGNVCGWREAQWRAQDARSISISPDPTADQHAGPFIESCSSASWFSLQWDHSEVDNNYEVIRDYNTTWAPKHQSQRRTLRVWETFFIAKALVWCRWVFYLSIDFIG